MLTTSILLPSRATFFSTLEPTTSTEDCAICTESLSSNAVTLHNTHTFCTDCSRAWLLNNTTCPMCRAELFSADQHSPYTPVPVLPGPLTPNSDHTTFLTTLSSTTRHRTSAYGSFWYISRGDDIISTMITQGTAWSRGHVTLREASSRPYESPRARAAVLSRYARRVDVSGLRVALVSHFMERVIGALSAGRWSGPECHPLSWEVFGVICGLLDEERGLLGRRLTAEELEDVVEERIWRMVRIPGAARWCSGDDWYAVANMEAWGELPRGCRDFVLSLVEEVVAAFEDDAPTEADVVERREAAL